MTNVTLSGLPDPALVARFAEGLERLWPAEDRVDAHGRTGALGLAVSGGPDSLAMLALAATALPGEIAVASVNHGLRPEAADEIAYVERVCAALEVPFTALDVTVAGGNLQARARAARYAALSRWVREQRLGALATAHHDDDQAETLLMRLARGSGLSGLAGVRAASPFDPEDGGDPFPLLRPLLGWRKAELEEIVASCGLVPVRDPSNEEVRFDRVRVRDHLAQHDWLDPAAFSTSAAHLAEAWRAIEWYAQIDWEEMVEREADSPAFRYAANVPRIIQIETVVRIVRELGGVVSRSEAGRAADRLWRGDNASLGGVLAVPTVERIAKVGVEMRVWRFSPEPPRRMH
ncbi:MAG: tRNA lysidine(34) synthetase TilS [Pseudomonadota bacterium]